MLSPKEYISLESAASVIKAQKPSALHEISRQLLAIAIPDSRFNPETIYVSKEGKAKSDFPLTYADIGNYLLAATGTHVPVLLETAYGVIASNKVMVRRDWVTRQFQRATDVLRVDLNAQEAAANDRLRLVESANSRSSKPWVDQPLPMDAKGYKQLKVWLLHQNDQRRASEAASKLAIQLEDAIKRAEKAEAISFAKQAEVTVLESRDRISIMELSAKERTIQSLTIEIHKLQEKLEDASTENKKPRPQPAKAKAKAAVHDMAKTMWADPEFMAYRISEMADFIRLHMIVHTEHAGAMPVTVAGVVQWIKEMEGIPRTASLPGRGRKSEKPR